MRNQVIFIFFCFLGLSRVTAQGIDLATLSPELLKGANAVIVREETDVTVEKLNKVSTRKRRVVAILNKQGEAAFETYSAYYDGFNKIRKIEAAAYRLNGELIVKSKNADVQDMAVNPFEHGVTDVRVKSISIDRKHLVIPYVLEFRVEEESSATFFYDDWTPVNFLHTPVIESTYRLRIPAGIGYRTREIHLDQPAVITEKDGWKTETWKLENYRAVSSDRYLPPNSVPQVFIEPLNFQIDKYSGTISSWNDIGDFYRRLNQGRDVLPAPVIARLKEAVGDATDPLEKARRVYRFMQGHTRYFNVSFRLGGWQSAPAALVAEKGYGDCKALTNYTLALLKEVGVKAWPALVNSGVRTGYTELDDFPRNAFNHIIACVPAAGDTVWLECTSQTSPFGYLGSFTGNRRALLITDEGSRLVNTRSYSPEENVVVSSTRIRLQKDGPAEVTYRSSYSGIRREEVYSLALSRDREKQKRWLTGKTGVSDAVWGDFRFDLSDGEVIETAALKAPALGSISGERFFFRPHVINSAFSFNGENELQEQTGEFYLNPNLFSFTDSDTVTVTLPAGYALENRPRDVKLEAPFGYYEAKVLAEQPDELQYIRNVKVSGGHYSPEVYRQWIDFIKAVNRADGQRTVLKKI